VYGKDYNCMKNIDKNPSREECPEELSIGGRVILKHI
jgi:hypothetical protein